MCFHRKMVIIMRWQFQTYTWSYGLLHMRSQLQEYHVNSRELSLLTVSINFIRWCTISQPLSVISDNHKSIHKYHTWCLYPKGTKLDFNFVKWWIFAYLVYDRFYSGYAERPFLLLIYKHEYKNLFKIWVHVNWLKNNDQKLWRKIFEVQNLLKFFKN
jgi:hypothetical protein